MTPAGGPERVERAREAAQALADQLPADRAAIDTAKAELVAAEKADREALAQAMREQREPVSNVEAVARAREAVGVSERHHAARRLAVADASEELRVTVEACREEWARTTATATERARRNARKTLERLTGELQTLAQAQATGWWLAHVDQQQSPPPAVLGSAPGSAFAQANGAAVSGNVLLGWVAELIDPPQTPQERREAAAVVAE
jgi:hypothetical protein